MDLKKKFDSALQKFVEREKKKPSVIGILASGSYVHSNLDKNSDIDVYIVTKGSKYRERGNTWINGVEIEYFENPVKQIEHYFKEEKQGRDSPATAYMFVYSKVMYKEGAEVDKLIKIAKDILKKPKEKMKKIEIESAKYSVDDLKKDLEDVYIRKDKFAFNQIANEILNKCLDVFCKVKRVSKRKPKRLFQQLKKLDSRFAKLYSKALMNKRMKRKYERVVDLVNYTEYLLGGKRPKEWKLRSKCPYLDE